MKSDIEQELVEGCWRQDRSAQRQLYELTSEKIHRLMLRMTRNADDAFDLAQDTYLRAFARMDRFDGRSSLATWLYRIAINCCKDWVKQAHNARRGWKDEVWWSERSTGDGLFTSSARTESMIEQREAKDFLQAALERLRPEFRSALVLREIEGMERPA